jgi:hypothetical protein
MANSHATVNSAIIAQAALNTLQAKFPLLGQIATDFSSASVKFNQDIVTHIVTPTVAKDFVPATGYVPDDQAQVDVSVKINKHAYAGYAITDVERSTSEIDLNQRYADKVAYALGRKVSDDLMALIINANFTNKTEIAAASFGRSAVVDISTKLNKRFIPDMGRFMFVNSDYYNALQKDEALYKAYITPAAAGFLH